jgi:hypothetical protein
MNGPAAMRRRPTPGLAVASPHRPRSPVVLTAVDRGALLRRSVKTRPSWLASAKPAKNVAFDGNPGLIASGWVMRLISGLPHSRKMFQVNAV